MKTDPNVKPNSLRDDLRYRPEAIVRGWTPTLSVIDKDNGVNPVTGTPDWPLQFKKGNRTLWLIRDGWRCADIHGTTYTNHRTHPNLVAALEKESGS